MVNFLLMDKEVFLASFSTREQLGGPDNSILNIGQGSITNSSIVSNDSTDKTIQTNSVLNETSLINQATAGKKLITSTNTEKGYFIAPTTGWNWGILHTNNAIDIANDCGTPVYAAAEGLVSESSSNGWNSGYGSYVKIDHSNGTRTLYAHLARNTVKVNQYIFQGDLIGYMGNTGNTHGPTGCHLHFEVRGAKNPLAK